MARLGWMTPPSTCLFNTSTPRRWPRHVSPLSMTWDRFWATRQASNASSATHFVVGNEAADLDSVACAIAYAYFDMRHEWIPVIQARRCDLRLRRENVAYLEQCGIDMDKVCCMDDVPDMHRGMHVVLVDHNRATKAFESATIDAIWDHHVDEHAHPEARVRVVCEPHDAGSCASVLVTHFRPSHMPGPVARLLYGAMLLDTLCWDEKAGKFHAIDRAAQQHLAPFVACDDDAALYRELLRLRNDTSHLTVSDHLRRDYKHMTCPAPNGAWSIGMASVTQPLHEMVSAPTFLDEVRTCARQEAVHVLMILAGYERDGTWHRELFFFAWHPSAKALADALASLRTHYVDLTALPLALPEHDGYAVAWTQHDLRATRKQFVPAMKLACEHVACP